MGIPEGMPKATLPDTSGRIHRKKNLELGGKLGRNCWCDFKSNKFSGVSFGELPREAPGTIDEGYPGGISIPWK